MNSQIRLNPIHRNDPFVCKRCKEDNPKATKGCRNHCRKCLYSVHVDQNTPGDRLSQCLGYMAPADIEQNQKGFQILHTCEKCEKSTWNKVAEDDDLNMVTHLIKLHNERTLKYERKQENKRRIHGKRK